MCKSFPRFAVRSGGAMVALMLVVWTAWLFGQGGPRPSSRPTPRTLPHREPIGPAPVTFSKEVVRILQARCQTCHREGGIAPFPLLTYSQAFARKDLIRFQTRQRNMPPWHAESGCSEFLDNPSLTEGEIETLDQWVAAGASEGDPRDLPPPLSFPSGWELGEPDRILAMEEPMTPDFSRGDVYRCFVLPTGLSTSQYLSGVEVAPGNSRMVHHVVLFGDTSGASEQLDARDPGPGYSCFGGPGFDASSILGLWAPGNRARFLPEGIGLELPRESRIVMQVHYSALNTTPAPDRTSVGLHFAKHPVQKRLLVLPVVNENFRIPAGASRYPVTATFPFIPASVHALAITPHMHLLGREMGVTSLAPDQRETCLISVPNWDFRHQRTYFFRNPVALTFGSRINVLAHYDNSSANPANPSFPPQDVTYGEHTTDEMCLALLWFTLDAENLSGAPGLAATSLDSFPAFWEANAVCRPRP